MKMLVVAAPLLVLCACDAAPPAQNVIQDVAANNMIADDVTEVQDDSASAAPGDTEEPGVSANSGEAADDSTASGQSRDNP
jgi:hypothetical protein